MAISSLVVTEMATVLLTILPLPAGLVMPTVDAVLSLALTLMDMMLETVSPVGDAMLTLGAWVSSA